MASLRGRLERDLEHISPPDLTYDDLWRRRAHKRRNDRLKAMVVALAVAAIGVVVPLRILGGIGDQPRPAAKLTASTVDALEITWSLPSDPAGFASPPAVVGDVVVTLERTEGVRALKATTGEPLWTAPVPDPSAAGVAASEDAIVVVSGSGELLAFDPRCRTDGGPCRPAWTAEIEGVSLSAITLADGFVLASSTQGVHAFEAPCAASACRPAWTAPVEGGVSAPPIVAGGTSVVASADGSLYAFDLDCGRDESECSPTWIAPPTSSTAFVSVAAAGGVVYAGGTDGDVYAFSTECRRDGGVCRPTRIGTTGTGGAVRTLAVTESQVLAAPSSGGLHALPRACDVAPCGAVWTAETDRPLTAPPAVSGEVVFVATVDGQVLALDTACDGPCVPVWTAETELDSATIAVTPRAVVVAGSGSLLGFTSTSRSSASQ